MQRDYAADSAQWTTQQWQDFILAHVPESEIRWIAEQTLWGTPGFSLERLKQRARYIASLPPLTLDNL